MLTSDFAVCIAPRVQRAAERVQSRESAADLDGVGWMDWMELNGVELNGTHKYSAFTELGEIIKTKIIKTN